MKYYSYNDYHTDPSVDPYVATLSEEEILKEYWDYWRSKMIEKYGKEIVESKFNQQDCIDDWVVVHWAWESD